jgi:hypothetical protein
MAMAYCFYEIGGAQGQLFSKYIRSYVLLPDCKELEMLINPNKLPNDLGMV